MSKVVILKTSPQTILQEGWIGPYVGSGLGQPTDPLYWTAFVFKIFDHPQVMIFEKEKVLELNEYQNILLGPKAKI